MASSQAIPVPAEVQQKARRIAGVIIGGHGFQHMYADGFLVLVNPIVETFGLSPFMYSLLPAVRQGASGVFSMGGGFFLDLFAGKRGLLLSLSLFVMGLGYFLMAAAPNYALALAAMALGAAAGSFWHPLGLGILSQAFPTKRGFMVSLHRSSGSAGEVITPLVAGAALAVITWRGVLFAGFIIITVVATSLYVSLGRLGLQQRMTDRRPMGEQFQTLKVVFRTRALPMLLLVAGLRSIADRGLFAFLPLLIAQLVRQQNPAAGDAEIAAWTGGLIALVAVTGIFVGPVFGGIADRIGRKPVILMALIITIVVLTLMWKYSTLGIVFIVLVGAMGSVRFVVNIMTQTASLDVSEGMRLEGSMIGLLWGNNALFAAFAPVLLGFLIDRFTQGTVDYRLIFPYAIGFYLLATVAAFFLPQIHGRRKAAA